jgi:regulator of CtrA degradation
MSGTADLSPTIVETLYCEALVLADEARAAFDLSGRMTLASEDEDLARVALSCEALRTTTRIMHGIAWLLNHRAYFAGELTAFQLRHNGRLPPSSEEPEGEPLAALPIGLDELVDRTKRLYARIERLDVAWHDRFPGEAGSVHSLHDQLGHAVASL